MLFVLIPFEGHSAVFIVNVLLFYLFAFLRLAGSDAPLIDKERLRSRWTVFFLAMIILFLQPILLIYREFDAMEYWRFQRPYLIFLGFPLLFFMGFTIDLKQSKTFIFMIAGICLDIIMRLTKMELFTLEELFDIKHHAILSLQIEMCLLTAYLYLVSNFKTMKKTCRRLIILLIISISVFSFINPVGRIGIFCTAVVLFFILLDVLRPFYPRPVRLALSGLFIAALGVFILKTNHSFIARMETINSGQDERLYIFKGALEINKEHLSLFGVGISQTKALTLKKWKEIDLENGYEGDHLLYNFHNSYLQEALAVGIFGLIISIVLLYAPIFFVKSPFYSTLILPVTLIFIIQSFTESIFLSTQFIPLFVVYMGLISFNKTETKPLAKEKFQTP